MMEKTPGSTEPEKRLASVRSPLAEEEIRLKRTCTLPPGCPDWAQALCQTVQHSLDTNSDELRGMRSSFDSMRTEFTNFKNGIETRLSSAESSSGEALTLVKKLEERVNALEIENSALKKVIQNHDSKIQTVETKQVSQEIYSRADNLEIHGVPETKDENCEKKARNVMRDLGMVRVNEVELSKCHRIGRKINNASRPILCRFQYYPDRQDMWSRRKQLEGTNIFIKENFPKEVEEKRRKLIPCLQKARTLPQYNGKCWLVKDKLIIDGKTYTVDTIHELPSPLNPESIYTPTKDGVTLFYTQMSPLSNFYRVHFKLDGAEWNSVEQYYSYKMAQQGNDPIAMRDIRKAEDGRTCKAIVRNLTDLDRNRWAEVAAEILAKGVEAKFRQNENLKQLLKDTGTNILGEANPHSTFWGTGKSMKHKDAFKPATWPQGGNQMGKILMDIRDNL